MSVLILGWQLWVNLKSSLVFVCFVDSSSCCKTYIVLGKWDVRRPGLLHNTKTTSNQMTEITISLRKNEDTYEDTDNLNLSIKMEDKQSRIRSYVELEIIVSTLILYTIVDATVWQPLFSHSNETRLSVTLC